RQGTLTEKLGDICRFLKKTVPGYDWVGFYLVDLTKERELILGPFDGEPTEHVRIPFGRGICGQAAESEKVLIVEDVSKNINYLSCGIKVKSEIVLPIWKEKKIVAELDIDSHTASAFDANDQAFLEQVCDIVSRII
ncbi:MAG: GAF domain-containing protein, partial [candidate division Zixibacteria bacterium]|nr:GAF domain-containing protein [candidate division Zixibacteria bacterium]